MDSKLKGAEIETTLESFAYWLERDWPRIKEFDWLELRPNNHPQADPRFERKWLVLPRVDNRKRLRGWPIFSIFAQTTTPGKVTAVWRLTPPESRFEGGESPIESVAHWVWFRFQAEAEDPGEDDSMVARATLESITTKGRGRPPKQLYDEAADLLLNRDDGHQPSGFETIYKWWLNKIGKKHSKALRSKFKKAMDRRIKADHAEIGAEIKPNSQRPK